ncbi:immunoglobulin-like domain-containing protein, partial [Aliarcobacter cryaerophilus]
PTEGDTVTFKVSLEDLDGVGGLDRHTGVKVTLSNGVVIEIPAGEIEGTGTTTMVDPDKIFVGDWTQDVTITNIEQLGAERFEDLVKGDDKVTLNVTDKPGTEDPDPENPTGPQNNEIIVGITTENVTEDKDSIFTISINKPVSKNVEVILSNGDTVIIEAGETS